ncbi:metallophosphoesterase family protein [Actinoplanes palleronii]|uniref:Metallophosphoesterase n=1 Tax=Actinoplanes palleronii TaxID=113570 RepID=A0ABQ4BJS2_9ACTN|nr:metallophosphoesterase [Actinoplanes palleronii]GIE70924.1 metallophosphoesterase [Actinoplanes palleronii]
MLTVAHVSDLHLGAHDPDTVRSLIADVTAARPVLTVVTGDVTMRARVREFRQARTVLDRLPQPLLVVLGNHDLPLISPLRVLWPYGRFRTWITSDLQPVVRVPGLTAVGLSSMPRWRWKDGRITRRQAARITGTFGAAAEQDLRLVALHHPPGSLAGRGRLREAVREAGVHLLVAGHTHIPDVRPEHGTVVVVAGTATSHRTRGTGQSWNLIRINSTTITVCERYATGAGWSTGRVIKVSR